MLEQKNKNGSQNETVTNPIPNGERIPSIFNNYKGDINDNNSFIYKINYELNLFKNITIINLEILLNDEFTKKIQIDNIVSNLKNLTLFFNNSIKFYELINTNLNKAYFLKIDKIVRGFYYRENNIIFFVTFSFNIWGNNIYTLYV